MKSKAANSNFPIRLNVAERPVLLGLADRLGLTYKNRTSVGQILHYLAAGECAIFVIAQDTSSEMRATAQRIRTLLNSISADDYTALEPSLSALAASLENAADIRAEFETDES